MYDDVDGCFSKMKVGGFDMPWKPHVFLEMSDLACVAAWQSNMPLGKAVVMQICERKHQCNWWPCSEVVCLRRVGCI